MNQAPVSPVPGNETAPPRRPRILLVSELFPFEHDVPKCVNGAYQRLRRNLDAINEIGQSDAIMIWPGNHEVSGEEAEAMRLRIQSHWPISGRVAVVGTDLDRLRPTFQALLWTLRGAVSFGQRFPAFAVCGESQAARVREAIRAFKPDLIFAHRLGSMGVLIRTQERLPPVVFDIDDMEHVCIARREADAGGPRARARVRVFIEIARRTLRIAARRARVSLLCSGHDQGQLSAMVPGARIEVLPNAARGVDPNPPVSSPTALFVGVATYRPNTSAIRSLVTEIWPRVCRRVPAAQLTIVGRGAPDVAASDPEKGINVFDFEPDLDGFYRNARISVCPIRSGGGTRVKIIEAAMYGRPVVSTTVGAEGLNFVPGSEILIADELDAFAEACAALLLDDTRCEQIALAARKRAMDEYLHERVVNRLAGILTGVLESEGRNGSGL